LLDRFLQKVLAANRRISAAESTNAFDRLKAIADEGIIAFCEKALGFTPTDYQADFLLDTRQFVAQCWCRQCVDENTFVYLSNGNIARIKDLPEAVYSGEKECFSVLTDDGREITATAEHRFLTRKGWKRLDQLSVGSRILVPDIVSLFGATGISPERAKILAYLITDGSFGHPNQSVKFTGKEPYISEMESCVRKEFPDIRPKRYQKGNCVDLLLTSNRGNVRENTLNAWLRRLVFLDGFPKIAFDLPEDKLTVFLNRMFAADGYIAMGSSPRNRLGVGNWFEIGFGTPSHHFAKALGLLLLKFGIRTHIRVEHPAPTNKYSKPFFRLRIHDITSQVRFFGKVGPIFGKENRSLEAMRILGDRQARIEAGECPKVTTFRHFDASS
jgi:replicative DNA helicase